LVPDSAPDLALYVHWPYCARICPYCDFNVARARGREAEAESLAEALVRDLETQAEGLGPRRLVSIFFGGGTPSLMDPASVARIVETASRLFPPATDLEVTLEANPTDAEAERFAAFADAGVERLSLGLQSLDDQALAFLGRNHDSAEGRRAAEAAAGAFPRLSVDLIYARPGQTPDAWARELREAIALGAGHVSPYQLTIEAGTPFGLAVKRGRFAPPDQDLAADLYDVTQAVLEAEGFDAYEVSNHARGQAARSRHNLAIWKGAEYLGIGPGAHGRVRREGVRLATRGAPKIADYLARVAETGSGLDTADALSPRDAAEERALLGLRITDGLPLADLTALGLSPGAEPTRGMIEAGLLRLSDGAIAATPAGRLVLDRVIADLLTA
jgi:oxygen-independent coproporphyrinogen-3 oxidase